MWMSTQEVLRQRAIRAARQRQAEKEQQQASQSSIPPMLWANYGKIGVRMLLELCGRYHAGLIGGPEDGETEIRQGDDDAFTHS